ncbi:helix-turn-helix transcriptional regulator [Nitratifractor sp.]
MLRENRQLLSMEDLSPRIEAQILREIFEALYVDHSGGARCKFDAKRARDFLHETLQRPEESPNMATQLQISERQIERAFKKLYGITPKRYLLNLRMNAVRKELLQADPRCVSVSEIAMQWGFFDLSHFSKAYKQYFCELPSETLARST